MRTKPAQQNAGRDLMLAALAGYIDILIFAIYFFRLFRIYQELIFSHN